MPDCPEALLLFCVMHFFFYCYSSSSAVCQSALHEGNRWPQQKMTKWTAKITFEFIWALILCLFRVSLLIFIGVFWVESGQLNKRSKILPFFSWTNGFLSYEGNNCVFICDISIHPLLGSPRKWEIQFWIFEINNYDYNKMDSVCIRKCHKSNEQIELSTTAMLTLGFIDSVVFHFHVVDFTSLHSTHHQWT